MPEKTVKKKPINDLWKSCYGEMEVPTQKKYQTMGTYLLKERLKLSLS